MRILIVEDDPGHALLVERVLRRGGIKNEIHHFEEGGQLLEHLAQAGAHGALVLLDLHLPRIDGFEVLRRWQSDPALAAAGVIVLTTTADVHDLRVCAALGCRNYMLKPIDFQRFVAIVHELGLGTELDFELGARSAAGEHGLRPT